MPRGNASETLVLIARATVILEEIHPPMFSLHTGHQPDREGNLH
jgi:hypothetical protein